MHRIGPPEGKAVDRIVLRRVRDVWIRAGGVPVAGVAQREASNLRHVVQLDQDRRLAQVPVVVVVLRAPVKRLAAPGSRIDPGLRLHLESIPEPPLRYRKSRDIEDDAGCNAGNEQEPDRDPNASPTAQHFTQRQYEIRHGDEEIARSPGGITVPVFDCGVEEYRYEHHDAAD